MRIVLFCDQPEILLRVLAVLTAELSPKEQEGLTVDLPELVSLN